MSMVPGDCYSSCLGCVQSSVSFVCRQSVCACHLTIETQCFKGMGCGWEWDAEALRAFVFIQNSISHLLPAGRESVQYLFCFCFTLNL